MSFSLEAALLGERLERELRLSRRAAAACASSAFGKTICSTWRRSGVPKRRGVCVVVALARPRRVTCRASRARPASTAEHGDGAVFGRAELRSCARRNSSRSPPASARGISPAFARSSTT